jgi:hypothetical protein
VAPDGLYKEAVGQLSKARALLASAHRCAVKMPLDVADQEKSRSALSEAIGLCVTVTHTAKANNLYRLLDSGLNPSELRHSVERALTKPTRTKSSEQRPRSNSTPAANDPQAMGLLLQLDACRRINLEGLRWLGQGTENSQEAWRGKQLLKIAEQLCVTTALESKLLGKYPLGRTTDEPAMVRKAIAQWAGDATRRELADE